MFVDEAYAEFAGVSFIPELAAYPNVIVGRTFSKAFGLAGLRIGCLVGAPDTVDPIRRAVPVYSVSIAAVVAVQAALGDLDHLREYLRQVHESKAMLYAACDRLGLSYVPSHSNFVLVRAGDRTDALVKGALVFKFHDYFAAMGMRLVSPDARFPTRTRICARTFSSARRRKT